MMSAIKVEKFDDQKLLYEYTKKDGEKEMLYLMEPLHGENGERYYNVTIDPNKGYTVVEGLIHEYQTVSQRRNAKTAIKAELSSQPIVFMFKNTFGKIFARLSNYCRVDG